MISRLSVNQDRSPYFWEGARGGRAGSLNFKFYTILFSQKINNISNLKHTEQTIKLD